MRILDDTQRKFAERTLNHLFVGSQLDGVKFGVGSGPILIRFMHYVTNKEPDELWVNIESKWTIIPSETNDHPVSEDDIEDLTEEEKYSLIIKLRREKVADIKLGKTAPHLIIVFQSGLTMFVNGHHNFYECWQAGDGVGYVGEGWLVVAAPGNEVFTQVPDDFR